MSTMESNTGMLQEINELTLLKNNSKQKIINRNNSELINVRYFPFSYESVEKVVVNPQYKSLNKSNLAMRNYGIAVGAITLIFFCGAFIASQSQGYLRSNNLKSFIMSDFPPFSVLDPESLGVSSVERSDDSKPGYIFRNLLKRNIPIPTNMWCENLFLGHIKTDSETNRVYVIPYVVDTGLYNLHMSISKLI